LWADFQCEFHLLHVVISGQYTTESLLSSPPNENVYSALLHKTKKELLQSFEELSANNQNAKHSFRYHLDHDDFLDAIHQVVVKENIDVVVLGSNGASNVKEVLFGTHALNIMRRLPHNVLVVPDGFQFRQVRRVLLLLDRSDHLHDLHIRRINDLISTIDAQLYVLSVDPDSNANELQIKEHFNKETPYHQVEGVPLEHAASTYAQTNGISLILMVGQMAGFVDRLRGNQGKTNLSKLYHMPLFLIRD
jgi:nucleotide-binding universal stress UspA family protein/predicted transposase YbfD/YdcC